MAASTVSDALNQAMRHSRCMAALMGKASPRAIADKDNYKIKLDPKDKKPGQVIHQQAIQFEQISHSSFCGACHQVACIPASHSKSSMRSTAQVRHAKKG